ncbi:MAG: hypothetical protein COA79_05330 [Planctomycetota bacterium]|nr:MAG: hypothetical protein COA79_05330 [Planctomycetota bacterium]
MEIKDELSFEEFEEIERAFAKIIQMSCSILLVGPSRIKCQSDLNSLKEAGFFNVTVETRLSTLPMLIKKGNIRVIVIDGDMKDNESLKLFLSMKSKKDLKLPEFLFIREDVSDNMLDVFQKAGALGCIHKPLVCSEFENAISSILFDEDSSFEEFSVESKPFGESTLIKIKGDLHRQGINELSDKLKVVQNEQNDGCLIDFSRVTSVDKSIVEVFNESSDSYKSVEKSIDIFDPKRKLIKFALEKVVKFI